MTGISGINNPNFVSFNDDHSLDEGGLRRLALDCPRLIGIEDASRNFPRF